MVVAVDGKTITFRTQLREAIASHPGREITLSVLRDGKLSFVTGSPGLPHSGMSSSWNRTDPECWRTCCPGSAATARWSTA